VFFCSIVKREKDFDGESILDHHEGDGQRQSAVLEGNSNYADNEATHQEQAVGD
jgi:hypothetical protein